MIAKKSTNAEVICSSAIHVDHVGAFYNSFHLTNYDWNQKSKKPEEPSKDEKDFDDRTLRHTKVLDGFQVSHESADLSNNTILKRQIASAEATVFARNLSCTRGTEACPGYMEDRVRELCDKHKELVKEVRVIKGQQLLDERMGLFHAVGRAAVSEPRLVMVHYQGDPESDQTLALVGKGITFDTGGLNLKGTGYMEDMYNDKNGACAVIGALHGVLATKPKINIVFSMCFAENSIDSACYKPNDIITSRKGLTIEIGNTDAEGRLVLADGMTYVQDHFKPHTLIDLATLTGAVRIALGMETAGLFSNDDELAGHLLASSKATFEPLWRLPITDEHRELMMTPYADMNNKGKTIYGGSSQAAAFLEKFIEKDVKWAHLDIAGPAMTKSAKGPVSADGNGFGTHILLDFIWKTQK